MPRAIPDIIVDLHRQASERWELSPTQSQQARELLTMYSADLGFSPDIGAFLSASAKDLIRAEHWQEMESLSRLFGLPVRDVVLCNLYYDALKVILGRTFGCTAFAVETPSGILHARNLDWWTVNSALARYTATAHFLNAPAGAFTTIGWPGLIGVYSGVAKGRFAVTLNAVLSLEQTQLATPVVFLLRTVLEEITTFEEALKTLCETPLPCDCLLLLSGVRTGELVVIERTPCRFALRHAKNGYVCVTNGYQNLNSGLSSSRSELLSTWCQRLERVESLIADKKPRGPEVCLRYLDDPQVKMDMTVQQMVFCAGTGEYWLR